MTSKIPPLLSSYIQVPPDGSLTLLTSVLSANANWLILRYLYAAFDERQRSKYDPESSPDDGSETASASRKAEQVKVVLVSWMRDFEFWKTEARRAVGLDLTKLQQQQHFAFVDGLTDLFAQSPGFASPKGTANPQIVPNRSGLPNRARPPPLSSPASAITQPSLRHKLSNPSVQHLISTVLTALSNLTPTFSTPHEPNSSFILILDTPSILLQSTSPPITSTDLNAALLVLRTHFHATIVSLPADGPLLAPASALAAGGINGSQNVATPLETENSALIVGLGHQARCVIGCRMLGTGFADDVSGVVRVTRGGGVDDLDCDSDGQAGVTEGEWLYLVGGDGAVKVWGRGGLDMD